MLLSMYRNGHLKLDELGDEAVPPRSDQRSASPICAKDATSAASSNSIKALVSRRVRGVDPQVDAQFAAGHAVVDRQIGDTGLEQHVLAQQGLAGVIAGRAVAGRRMRASAYTSGLRARAIASSPPSRFCTARGGHQRARPQRVGRDAVLAQFLGDAPRRTTSFRTWPSCRRWA